ncbi:hypothetical protein U14_04870 [Candidatus Moduliflexus flocculans]|uniref:Uncharacterized protein n=1 Tax=Candidatus Moduliflexus flocculans TaxID=1499966 RepID=A0A0S6W560_9BACT|nr:hypothetical protein U14_04870 [Candidatus Moduliflexus flocculans]
MIRMFIKHTCTIEMILLFGQAVSATTAPDNLWQKAVAIAGNNVRWIPGVIMMTSEEFDKHDRVQKTEEAVTRLSLGENGMILSETTAMKDGKKVASQKKTSVQEETGKDSGNIGVSVRLGQEDFFMPERQATVSATPTGQRKTIDDVICVEYVFTQQKSPKEKLSGSAWLDETSGAPVEVAFTTIPLPKHVKQMASVIHYHSSPDAWYPIRMQMEASGGFLLIQKHVRIRLEMNDYWQAPKKMLEK